MNTRLLVPVLALLAVSCTTPTPVPTPTPAPTPKCAPATVYGVVTAWQEVDGQAERDATIEPLVGGVQIEFCPEGDHSLCETYVTVGGYIAFKLAPGGYDIKDTWPTGYQPLYDNVTYQTASPGRDMYIHLRGTQTP